jgi:hypothetical protein
MSGFLHSIRSALGFEKEDVVESSDHLAKVEHFNTHISDLQKVRDAFQLYTDSIEAMFAAQLTLADSLDTYYRSSSAFQAGANNTSISGKELTKSALSNMSKKNGSKTNGTSLRENNNNGNDPKNISVMTTEFLKLTSELYNSTRPSIHEILVTRCIKPITSMLSRVPYVRELLVRRKKLMGEFELQRKELERSADNNVATKAGNKLVPITEELSDVNFNVDRSLNEYAIARPFMLSQEMSALIGCLYHQSHTMTKSIGKLLPYLPQSASTLCLLQASANTRLAKMDKNHKMTLNDANQYSVEGHKVAPMLARSKAMGGKSGGYGVTTSSEEALKTVGTTHDDKSNIKERNTNDVKNNKKNANDKSDKSEQAKEQNPLPSDGGSHTSSGSLKARNASFYREKFDSDSSDNEEHSSQSKVLYATDNMGDDGKPVKPPKPSHNNNEDDSPHDSNNETVSNDDDGDSRQRAGTRMSLADVNAAINEHVDGEE